MVAQPGEGISCSKGFDVFEQLSRADDERELFGDCDVEIAFVEKPVALAGGEEFDETEFVLINLEGKKSSEACVPNFPSGDGCGISGGLAKWDVGATGAFLGSSDVCEFAVDIEPDSDSKEVESTANTVSRMKGGRGGGVM